MAPFAYDNHRQLSTTAGFPGVSIYLQRNRWYAFTTHANAARGRERTQKGSPCPHRDRASERVRGQCRGEEKKRARVLVFQRGFFFYTRASPMLACCHFQTASICSAAVYAVPCEGQHAHTDTSPRSVVLGVGGERLVRASGVTIQSERIARHTTPPSP